MCIYSTGKKTYNQTQRNNKNQFPAMLKKDATDRQSDNHCVRTKRQIFREPASR